MATGEPINYSGPEPSVECGYGPCQNRLRKADWPGSQFCSKEHRTEAEAERAFLAASVEVWREIDRLSAEPEGYQGIDASTDLRQRERAAWERYRAVLDRKVG